MAKILTLRDKAELKKIKEHASFALGNVRKNVESIISDVRKRGDVALIDYAQSLDKANLKRMVLTKEDIRRAYGLVDKKLIGAIRASAANVRKYHVMQKPREWMKKISKGIEVGQLIRPLDSVGCYVPGGNYPLVSTVIMTVVPASVAGVKEIVVCSPPLINPAIIVAADMCGATIICSAGGAQAVAAMAYGTESVPKVNKIVGPGNIYVTAAKKSVYGDCNIDFIAGPSEIMIVADEKGNSEFIAADMLSQAEHDRLASAILVTTSRELAEKVNEELGRQLKNLSTGITAKESLENQSAIIIVDSMEQAFEIVNDFAPEHLEIMLDDKNVIKKVRNAGAIFLGNYSPEAAGDYASGPNHVLPTNQVAKSRAGLSVFDFLKMPSVQRLTKEGLMSISSFIKTIAETEGLEAHKTSVEVREND
ncbi:histidinol dehydrogenase [Candidatus Woesearchaeota archaeon]|nr:histidinol dehydrogenase [Candidatus Woesearchaeota archaeon]